MTNRIVSTLALAAVMGWSGQAAAQAIDYTSLEELFGEPVTASATGKPQRSTDVPVTMEIITAEQIRRAAATDIPGVLAEMAGVEVSRGGIGHSDVSVRGYNQPYSPRLLVLVDGRQVYLDHFAMTNWSAIPVQLGEIKQIEVVKGPNAALFGFNAVAGVINIVTFNPLYDDVNRVSATVGTQEHRELSAIGSAKAGKVGVRLSAGAASAREFTKGATAFDQPFAGDFERRTVNADTLIQVGDRSQLGISGSASRVDQTELLPFPSLAAVTTRTYSGKVTYTTDTSTGLWEATLYHNGMETDLSSASTPSVPMDNHITVAKLQDLFKLGVDHTMRLGAEYRNNTLTTTPVTSGEVGYDVYSASAMWDWAISAPLSWTNAIRFDRLEMYRSGPVPSAIPFTNADWDRSINGFSFNSGLVYKATEQDTLRASMARGLQTPSLIELGFQQVGAGTMAGNPGLEPTVVKNVEIGWDRNIPALSSTTRVTAFYQTSRDLKGLPGQVPDSGTLFLFHNVGNSKIYGLELGLKGGQGPWKWDAAYTYQQVEDDLDSTVASLNIPVSFKTSTPNHLLRAHLGYRLQDWRFDGYARFRSATNSLRLTNPSTAQRTALHIPGYVDLSARVGYDVTDWLEAAVIGTSLNQGNYRESEGLETERRALFQLNATF